MRKLLWLCLLLVSPTLAWAQGARYDGVAFRYSSLNTVPAPGALITVYQGASQALIYTDAALTNRLNNPFPADNKGNFGFYAAAGTTYTIDISGNALVEYQLTWVAPLVSGGTASFSTIIAASAGPSAGQQHTLPAAPSDTFGLLAATQTFTNKTFDVSSNTLKNSTNTAGRYLRNNGTQYIDNTIQGADIPATTSNCTGVQFAQGLNSGHTPICTTPPTFVASGASHAVGYVPDPGSSAGATRFLREDATWAAPATSETTFGFASPTQSTISNSQATCATVNNQQCVTTRFGNAHTITRFTYVLAVAPVGCSTQPAIGVYDVTAASNLYSTSIANGASTGFVDSGALNTATTAGHQISVGITSVPVGCSTNAVVEFHMMVYQ